MRLRHFIVGVAIAAAVFFLPPFFIPRGAFGPGPSDFSTRLVGDYFIFRTSADEIIISPESWTEGTPEIPTKVVEYAVHRRLILAKRQGLKRLDPNRSYEEPDPAVFDYWILDTSAPKVFGPMSLDQFSAKRRELSVPESVTLKDVYSFRW